MTEPVIVVQGTPVTNPSNTATDAPGFSNALNTGSRPATNNAPASNNNNNSGFAGKGEQQESKCRDPIFAVLFYACIIAIVAVAVVYGPDAVSQDDEDSGGHDYTGVIVATIIVVIISFVAAGLGLAVLMCIPETLIKVSLIFVVIMAAVWMVMAFVAGSIMMGILGVIMFAFSLCYAKMVWSRIPFATVNLVTACTAVKANLGVTFFAYLLTAIAGVWSVTWSVAFAGVFDETYECNEQDVCSDPNYGFLFLLFVAYFFIHQVLQGCIHTTVAGTVGHWWFEPSEANRCCSPAVINSFIRTVTTSFGSVCFGSLIVAIIQALKMLANIARQEGDSGECGAILLCLAECILACLASIVEYFNKWAFIYVGLYGYSYMEAGKNVFTLFRNRGWEAVIADDLVGNTLLLISLVSGGVMGGIAVVIESTSDLFEDVGGNETVVAFLVGFIVGLVITSILMSTIGSGVNAVIVLFAEAPAEFQQNHPQLSTRMREVWNQVYPGSV